MIRRRLGLSKVVRRRLTLAVMSSASLGQMNGFGPSFQRLIRSYGSAIA